MVLEDISDDDKYDLERRSASQSTKITSNKGANNRDRAVTDDDESD